METSQLRRVNEVLEKVLGTEPSGRPQALERECRQEPEVRRQVESLLAADPELLRLLDEPAHGGEEDDEVLAGLPPGAAIGPYRVLREIGRGGMGEIYLAVRAEDVCERQVAVKIIRRGLDTAEIIRRFQAERAILAQLEHPYIARLLEGGTTADGRPYFAMEYVTGAPIDRYCDRLRLPVRERILLFRKVCEAVQYAHQHLVVHRDLKPSNILVSADGEPKLLDFGIAGLLDPSTDRVRTLLGGRHPALTPEYASPEQVRGAAVTTASDVYSLGVLLYELLTGHRPYRLRTPLTEQELRSVVCESRPARPSSQVDAAAAESCRERLDRLRRGLAGDLDNIVLMALAKEPSRRFASADQLSEDLRRYLEGRPVRARRSTLLYRLSKLLARRRKEVVAAAAAAGLLVWIAVDRDLQQRRTARERDRAQQVSRFLEELFEVSDPDSARGSEVTAREILDRGVERIGTELRDAPELKAALMTTMGRVYRNLGLLDEAQRLFEEAIEDRRGRFGAGSLPVAESQAGLASVLVHKEEDLERAAVLAGEALATRRRLLGRDDALIAEVLNDLAILERKVGDIAKARELLRQALTARFDRREGDRPLRLTILNNLAIVLQDEGDLAGAEDVFREILEVKRSTLGHDHPSVAATLNNLAMLLAEQGRHAEALPLMEEAIELGRKVYGRDHPLLSVGLANLGHLRRDSGDLEGALELYRECLAIRERSLGPDNPQVARVLRHLGELHRRRGDFGEAASSTVEAIRILEASLPPDHWRIADARSLLGEIEAARGRPEEAEPLLLQGYRGLVAGRGEAARDTVAARLRLEDFYRARTQDPPPDLELPP